MMRKGDNMMNKRDDYMTAISEMYPHQTEFNRAELVQAANSIGMKYAPSWIVKNDEHKLGDGLYSVVATGAPTVTMQQKVQEVAPMVEQPVSKKQIGIVDTTVKNIVPDVYGNYVPFGQFSDIKNIVKSKMFYPVFITGLSGNGKTMMVEQVCAKLKKEAIRVNISIETDEDDLIGGNTLVDGNVVYREGPVLTAMKRGAILILDEIDRGSNKLMCLQAILEGKPYFNKKSGEVITPATGFNVIATANTKGQGSDDGKFMGAQVLDEAFLERFAITVEQEYPSSVQEKKIIMNKMGVAECVDEDFADKLVMWADIIRKTFYEGGIDELVSTRRLEHIVKAYAMFSDRLKAIQLCVNRFDTDTKTAFIDLYTKVDAGVSAEEIMETSTETETTTEENDTYDF
jgi:MoxR-like ATPase